MEDVLDVYARPYDERFPVCAWMSQCPAHRGGQHAHSGGSGAPAIGR
jgi:hypothetical protein